MPFGIRLSPDLRIFKCDLLQFFAIKDRDAWECQD